MLGALASLPVGILRCRLQSNCVIRKAHPRHTFIHHLSMVLYLPSKGLFSLSQISDTNPNPISKRRGQNHSCQLRKLERREYQETGWLTTQGCSGCSLPLRATAQPSCFSQRSRPAVLRCNLCKLPGNAPSAILIRLLCWTAPCQDPELSELSQT